MKRSISVVILFLLAILLVAQASDNWFPDIVLTDKSGSWLDTRVYSDLSSALSAAGTSDSVTLHIVRTESVNNDLTIPSNVTIEFLGPGKILQTSGTTTINGDIISSDRLILSTSGTGSFDFADGMELRSSWFDSFDDAVAVTQDDTVVLDVVGMESVTSSQSMGDYVTLKFEGAGDYLYIDSGYTLSNVQQPIGGRHLCFLGSGRADFVDGVEVHSSWFERFDEAVRYLDDTEATLVFDSDDTLVSNVTVPETLSIKWTKGNVLALSANLTLNGPFEAGLYQVFDTSGGGATAFGDGSVSKVYPQWWGAVGDGVNDDTSAIQAAVDSLSSGGMIFFPSGTYLISSSVSISVNNLLLLGVGRSTSILKYAMTDGSSCIDIDDSGNDLEFVEIADLGFDGDATATGPAISYKNLDHSKFRNLSFRNINAGAASGTSVGIKIDEGYDNVFENLHFYEVSIAFALEDGSATLDGDLLHFQDIFHNCKDVTNLTATWKIAGRYTRVTIDGTNLCDQVKYGIYWDDAAQTTASLYGWRVSGVHCEGSATYTGQTAFHIKIGATGGGSLPFIIFENCYINPNWSKAYDLDGTYYVSIVGGGFTGSTGTTFIEAADSDVAPIILNNVFYNSNATISVPAELIVYRKTANGTASYAVWDDSSNATTEITKALVTKEYTLTYGATISINAKLSNTFYLEVTDGNAFTISNPTGGTEGQELCLIIRNTSGGAVGSVTWGTAYLFNGATDPTMPDNNKYTTIVFRLANSHWVETSRAENCWT